MFEFALSEMLLIGVVALVVLGPQRLPKVARTVGLWVGKIQYFVSNVKTELSRQVEASELRDVKESLESAARGLQDNLRDMDATARQEAKEIADGLNVPAWERLPEQKTPADFGVDEWGSLCPIVMLVWRWGIWCLCNDKRCCAAVICVRDFVRNRCCVCAVIRVAFDRE